MQYKSYEDYMKDFLGYGAEKTDETEIINDTYEETIENETRLENKDMYQEVYNRVAPLISEVTEKTIENVTDYIIYEVRKKLDNEKREATETLQTNEEKKVIVDNVQNQRDIRNIEQDVRKCSNCNNKSNPNLNYMNRYRKF